MTLIGSSTLGVYEANEDAFGYQFYLSRSAMVSPMTRYDPRSPPSSPSENKHNGNAATEAMALSLQYSRSDFTRQLQVHYLASSVVDLKARAEKLVQITS